MNQVTHDNKIRLLLDLVLKLNDTFLQASDLEDVLNAVLVGITAGEGLGFNRVFLFQLVDHLPDSHLKATKAIGPASPEDAAQVWNIINEAHMSLFDIMLNVKLMSSKEDNPLTSMVKDISVPLNDEAHIFVTSLREHCSLHIMRGDETADYKGAKELLDTLQTDEFAVVPLVTHQKPFGVIVADNSITRTPIEPGDVEALHLFAGLGSIAICQANMCSLMEERIVELQRLNAEVVRNRGLLIQAERQAAVGRMADQVLHQLKNPLSVIGGMAGLLDKKIAPDSTKKKYILAIKEKCAIMERILNELSDLLQVPEVNCEDVRLNKLVSASVDIFRHEFKRFDIECILDLPEPEPVICVDRTHFQQALVNVIKNAVEAMPDGGILHVSVTSDDNHIKIEVMDTGLGVAKGHLSRLDEPFFSTKSHAMGLGLSQGKKVLEQHGGTLSVEQNSNGGATVVLSLPVSRVAKGKK